MSYIICFWDKSKLQVNELTGTKLQEAILTDSIKGFKVGNSFYAVGGVEKIIPKDEAYKVFPADFEQLQNLKDENASLPQLENKSLN